MIWNSPYLKECGKVKFRRPSVTIPKLFSEKWSFLLWNHPPTGSYCPIFKCGMLGKRSATGSSISRICISLCSLYLFGVSGAKELYIFIFPMTKDQGATNWVYQSHDEGLSNHPLKPDESLVEPLTNCDSIFFSLGDLPWVPTYCGQSHAKPWSHPCDCFFVQING